MKIHTLKTKVSRKYLLMTMLLGSFLSGINGARAVELDDSSPPEMTFVTQFRDAIQLRDDRRNKIVTVRVTYPTGTATPCPVVVFSHGAGASKDAYQYLIRYWASHGYVCIQPSHDDSIDPSLSKGARIKQLLGTLRTLPTNYKLWGSRLSDVTFVISCLGFIQTKIPTNMDTSEIACAGHSLGAFTTAIISGTNVPYAGTNFATTTTDPRVKAAILLSPQGVRQAEQALGFDSQQSWHDMTIPALFITGTRDNTKFNSYKQRCDGYQYAPSGSKYRAILEGASHLTFAGHGAGPDESTDTEKHRKEKDSGLMTVEEGDHQAMTQSICALTTTFLDGYLKNSPPARLEMCKPGAFGPMTKVEQR